MNGELPRILVVENNSLMLEGIVHCLKRLGVDEERIVTSHNTAGAKDAWKKHEGRFSLVITDARHDDEQGWEKGGMNVIKSIRQETSEVPIILYSFCFYNPGIQNVYAPIAIVLKDQTREFMNTVKSYLGIPERPNYVLGNGQSSGEKDVPHTSRGVTLSH